MKAKNDASDLGQIINQIRILEGMSEEEIAKFLFVTTQTINKKDNGLRMWDIASLIKLSGKLLYKISIEKGELEIMHDKLDNEFTTKDVEVKKVKEFGKFSIIEVYSNSEFGVYGNISSSLDEVIAERDEAKKIDPESKILIGYCLYDNTTGFVPNSARDWHLTVESAEKEYRNFYEVREEFDMSLIRPEIIKYMDDNVEDMATSHLECWKDRYWGKSVESVEYDLNFHDPSLETEEVEESLDLELDDYEYKYVVALFDKTVIDLVRNGFTHLI